MKRYDYVSENKGTIREGNLSRMEYQEYRAIHEAVFSQNGLERFLGDDVSRETKIVNFV